MRINRKGSTAGVKRAPLPVYLDSLSIVGVGFVKIPPQFYKKGPFYV